MFRPANFDTSQTFQDFFRVSLTALLPATTHANIDFDSHYPALDGSNPILEKGVRFDFNAAALGNIQPVIGSLLQR